MYNTTNAHHQTSQVSEMLKKVATKFWHIKNDNVPILHTFQLQFFCWCVRIIFTMQQD